MADYIFEFSLSKDVAKQVEQLTKELKTPAGKLFKLFILRGIKALALVKKAEGSPPKRMKAAKGRKTAKPKAGAEESGNDNLVTIDLRNLSPQTVSFLRRFAGQQNISLAAQIEHSLDDGYGRID